MKLGRGQYDSSSFRILEVRLGRTSKEIHGHLLFHINCSLRA